MTAKATTIRSKLLQNQEEVELLKVFCVCRRYTEFGYSFHWVIPNTHTHTHHPWQAACGEAAQGCHIILNIHQLSRDIILAPHLHTTPTEWQTREGGSEKGERFLLPSTAVASLTWLPLTPLAPPFAPSISLSLPSNLPKLDHHCRQRVWRQCVRALLRCNHIF